MQVQKPAPQFEAMAHVKNNTESEHKSVKLSDYKGKWVVLFFYPADFTFVCPTELVAVAKHYDTLKSKNTEVLSISTDTHFTHQMWNEVELSKMIEGGLPYPMLWDKAGEIGRLYGVYDEEAGMDMRGAFIIDPDGILQSIMVTSPGVGRSAKELLRQLDAYQYTYENTGKVVPSDWEEGGQTLDPSLKLVGHVCDVMED
ncbi:redoxin domain-containing protein [bacterium]|nr:redoxin domain-containing protein [bacterium]